MTSVYEKIDELTLEKKNENLLAIKEEEGLSYRDDDEDRSESLAMVHYTVPEYGSTKQARVAFTESNHEEAIGTYPPGVAVNGSKNLPILEMNHEHLTRKKRRQKRNKIGTEAETVTSNQVAESGSETQPDELESEKPKRAPSILPPIQSKSEIAVGGGLHINANVDNPGQNQFLNQTNMEFNNKSDSNQTSLTYYKKLGGVENQAFVYDKSTGNDVENPVEHLNYNKEFFYKKDPAICFKDKIRKIDYILVYREDDDEDVDEDEREKREIREVYHKNLQDAGVELEIEPKEKSQDQKTSFVKIHVPWRVMLYNAERMKVKMPLKVEKDDHDHELEDQYCDCSWYDRFKKALVNPCELHNDIIEHQFDDQDNYTAEFTRSKLDYFDIHDEDTFFPNTERSRIAHRIMDETRYGNKRKDIGITRLLLDDVYISAYPLHDGLVDTKSKETENVRQLLYREWARWGRMFKFQPLDAIRFYLSNKVALYFAFLEFYLTALSLSAFLGLVVLLYGYATMSNNRSRAYLGDKIGIYFAWLGFYTRMLIIPTLVGLICLIYSLIAVWSYPPTEEICDEENLNYVGDINMCPLCDGDCTYYKLNTVCLSSRITFIFDNEATIFFAIFMSLWATMFLEFWKRRQFELSYKWDLVDYDEERDLVRPEYEAQIERERYNPATGKMETYMDPKDRIRKTGISFVTVLFWIAVIIAAVFSIIVYRLAINAVFAASLDEASLGGVVGAVASPSLLTTLTASLISVLVIMLLNKAYEKVAFFLTNWEIPRTREEFENSFTVKLFFFQFVNYYSYLFYIAFFKDTLVGRPGDYFYLFGEFRWEGCDAGGCMYELTIQLFIIMIAKQLWSNIIELLIPWGLNKYRIYKSRRVEEEDNNEYTLWEKDFDLADVNMDLFYEYLEIIIQFGFVTLFVAALPLAPLLALLNNIIEIRLDAIKFITEFKRPLALKCSNIGAWYFFLEFLGVLAVVTNSFTIAVTSDAIPKLVYYYDYSIPQFNSSTYQGYVNNSLSVFNVSDFSERNFPANSNPFPNETITECRYKDYRSPPTASPPYALTLQYWHVIAARLAFVIVMEHVVFFLKWLLDFLIPDRSKTLQNQVKREYYLVQNMLFEAEKEQLVEQFAKDKLTITKEPTSKYPASDESVTFSNGKKMTQM